MPNRCAGIPISRVGFGSNEQRFANAFVWERDIEDPVGSYLAELHSFGLGDENIATLEVKGMEVVCGQSNIQDYSQRPQIWVS